MWKKIFIGFGLFLSGAFLGGALGLALFLCGVKMQDISETFGIPCSLTHNEDEYAIKLGSPHTAPMPVVQKEFKSSYTYTTTWKGSTKSLTITGHYKAVAGISFRAGALRFSAANLANKNEQGVPVLTLPSLTERCILIQCEELAVPELRLDEGTWNKFSTQEISRAFSAARQHAREEAERTLLPEVEKRLSLFLVSTMRARKPQIITIN